MESLFISGGDLPLPVQGYAYLQNRQVGASRQERDEQAHKQKMPLRYFLLNFPLKSALTYKILYLIMGV